MQAYLSDSHPSNTKTSFRTRVCCFVTFLHRTPICELVSDRVEIQDQTSKMHMLRRDWMMLSSFILIKYSKINDEHNWEDMCV
jgi:hypothetical protein